MKQGHFIKGNRGFSLIEALIGFFILSIGMLGVASLQGVALKASQASVYGSVAMMKVEELFESMRANPTALTTYQNAGILGNCNSTNNCSATQLAADDVYWWERNLKAGLPDAATTLVTVTQAVAPSGLATVQIDVNWAERGRTSTASISRSYTTTANICTAVPC